MLKKISARGEKGKGGFSQASHLGQGKGWAQGEYGAHSSFPAIHPAPQSTPRVPLPHSLLAGSPVRRCMIHKQRIHQGAGTLQRVPR